jgi:hypothetical protein
MQSKSIKLPESLITFQVSCPETGMGYQIVKVFLKSGKVLHKHKVLNSELLMLDDNENINIIDIDKIELEIAN